MRSIEGKASGQPQDRLWVEALWGIGLLGVVFLVVVLVAAFGR
jgi:hypothetical protein